MKAALTPASSLSRLFDNWFRTDSLLDNGVIPESLFARPGVNVPSANIREDSKSYTLELAAPGLSRDDFKLELVDGVLTVSAEKEEEKETKEKKNGYSRREYSYNSFSRSFRLPENANEDKITAKYDKGILSVTVAKKKESAERPVHEIPVS